MKLSIGQAAKKLGVSINTLRRWDKLKIFESEKLPSGHRRYDAQTIEDFYTKVKEKKINN